MHTAIKKTSKWSVKLIAGVMLAITSVLFLYSITNISGMAGFFARTTDKLPLILGGGLWYLRLAL